MANRKERIAKGIKFLDKESPGWCHKVNLEVLDLGSLKLCVLGQVFSKQARPLATSGYGVGAKRLPVADDTDAYGFEKTYRENYFPLTQAWKRAIRTHCQH